MAAVMSLSSLVSTTSKRSFFSQKTWEENAFNKRGVIRRSPCQISQKLEMSLLRKNSTRLKAGHSEIDPNLNKDFNDRWATNGIDKDEFQYGKYDGHHTYIESDKRENTPIGEEARWLREEHRWIREEHRWLREEQRWKGERQALLEEITNLKLRIQELETRKSLNGATVPEIVAHVAKLVQVVQEEKNVSRITESGSSTLPLVVESTSKSEEVVMEQQLMNISNETETTKRRQLLQKGAEGDDVRAMQEALQKLGFYSGEEDMEYCSFSSGTERAVKTWQATLGVLENGVMTTELLDRLFKDSGSSVKINQRGVEAGSAKIAKNTAPMAIIDELSQTENAIATTEEDEISRNRVFLLGENRWEDPSRLNKGSKYHIDKKATATISTTCVSCRGEGRLLCMECDGTGEPNIEPQFLEWVDEGSKCPYCDGLGYTTCDVCNGRK